MRVRLQRFFPSTNHVCLVCNIDEEDHQNVFVRCSFAQEVGMDLVDWLSQLMLMMKWSCLILVSSFVGKYGMLKTI